MRKNKLTLEPLDLSLFEQFQVCILALEPKDGSKKIWLKHGHNHFFVATWEQNGKFRGYKTTLKDKGDPKSRVLIKPEILDLYKHLIECSHKENGGIFYLPTQPQEYPLAECVTSTDDIGIELDHLTCEEQILLYQKYMEVTGLEFALILTSGGKSIHAHLKADQHLPLEKAAYLRRLVTIAFNSDPACERLHQPMRMPGFYRKEKEAYQSLLWFCDRKYSYDQLVMGIQKWFQLKGWQIPKFIPDQWWSEIFVPLYRSGSKLDAEGKAKATAAALEEGPTVYIKRRKAESEAKARKREQYCQQYKGSTGNDLLEAVNRANNLVGPEAFLGDWAFSNSGHARGQCPFHQGSSGNSAWLSNSSSDWKFHCASCTNDQPRDAFEFWLALHGMSDIGSLKLPIGQEWADAAKQFLRDNGFEVPKLAPNDSDSLTEENREAIKDELKNLDQLITRERPLLFHPVLTEKLATLARLHNLPVEAFICCALPVLASCLHARTTLEINPATDFKVNPIIWMGVVGESGARKSPTIKALSAPLDKLQAESEDNYQLRLLGYETEMKRYETLSKEERIDTPKPEPPVAKEHYLSDFTLEALSQVVGQQKEDGLLILIDELARYFYTMDAYRSKGGDRQHWLSFYDGGALKTNRKTTGRIYAPNTSISVLGGIQPSIVQKLLLNDKSIHDGLWPRFAWVRIPLAMAPGISEEPPTGLKELLADLYRYLGQMPPKTYSLAADAKLIWNQWHIEIEQLIMDEPSELIRSLYPKARERAARVALTIHCVNSKLQDSVALPTAQIQAETLEKAIQFTRWLMGQTKLLYTEIGFSASLEVTRILKFRENFKGKGWVDARTTTRWWTGKKKPKATESRRFLAKIVELGYADSNGEAEDSSKYQIKIL